MTHANTLTKAGNPALTMSSLEISEVVESAHDDVKRSMERLAARGAITLPPLAEVPNTRPGPKTVMVYQVSKRDSYVAVAQLSPEFTARLVDRWQELEQKVAAGLLPNFASPAAAARAWAEQFEQKQIAQAERDEAVRTKAQIGSKREATAMAKASAASREATRLKDQLGFNARHATAKAVKKVTGIDYGPQWRKLRAWCKEHGEEPTPVQDQLYGEVQSWPAGAWLAAFGVDLGTLFPSVATQAA